MKRYVAVVLMVAVLVAGCGPSAEELAQQTAVYETQTAEVTPVSTESPTPTQSPTITLTATATYTPSPTMTPFPVTAFTPQVITYGDHGAMLELLYDGNPDNLAGLEITANLTQGTEAEETQSMFVDDGRILFEMTDAMYELGEIHIRVDIKTEGGISEVAEIEFDISYDERPAFIYSLFRNADAEGYMLIDNSHTIGDYGDENRFYAHDLWFGYGVKGIPIHMPFSFQLITKHEMNQGNPNFPYNYNIWIRNPYTGHVCVLQHVQPEEWLLDLTYEMHEVGLEYPLIEYDPDLILAKIGPKDEYSGLPHLHFECQDVIGWPHAFVHSWTGYDDGPGPEDESPPSPENTKRYGLCPGNVTPCDSVANIEILDYLLSGWID